MNFIAYWNFVCADPGKSISELVQPDGWGGREGDIKLERGISRALVGLCRQPSVGEVTGTTWRRSAHPSTLAKPARSMKN